MKFTTRRYSRVLVTWTVTSCFIFMITFNFYANVWTVQTELEVYPDHTTHHNGSYIWMASDTQYKHREANLHSEHSENASQWSGLWPDLNHYSDDRILNQLQYRPELKTDGRLKKILLYHGYKDWDVKPGRKSFLDQECPVNTCELTDNIREGATSDAILFRLFPKFVPFQRPPSQIWILFQLESPYNTPNFKRFSNMFNWTATYRRDSDIVTPYEKYVKYNNTESHIQPAFTKNYAAGKTKKVAWFASNCQTKNARLQYVMELSKYIQVDVYGRCGNLKCPRSNSQCFDMLDKDYKFYLSFENSNCRDYITEKFFVNGLQHDVIPIVMGAAPEDYRRVAPHFSYIHVDEYTGPKQLAEYLHELDANDDAYNEYFRWKDKGTFINTYFWCRVCAMLHDTSQPAKSYGDLDEWWRGEEVCINKDRWGQHPRTKPYISNYYGKSLIAKQNSYL